MAVVPEASSPPVAPAAGAPGAVVTAAGASGAVAPAADGVVVRHAGTAPATWAMGFLSERLLTAADTEGLLDAAITTQPPGLASPLHVHTREAEVWFLLDGTMTYQAGDQRVHLSAGEMIYLPRGVPHAFRTTGSVPTRFLAFALPGHLLDLYDEVGVPAPERRVPDGGVRPDDIARWLEAAPRYGLQIVGPPLPEDGPDAG